MASNSPTRLVTRGGQRLTAYAWESLSEAYRRAGLSADRLTVVQGSHKGPGGGAAASGSTHDAGDTADLRTRDLPAWARRDLCEPVVVELRRLGWCAWYRDQAHGGMDPHIHAVYRWADPPLSSGALSQVRDYDAGRDGLRGNGPDYHPRPKQAALPWPWPPPPKPPKPPTLEDDDMAILLRNVSTEQVALVSGSLAVVLSDDRTIKNLREQGQLRLVDTPAVDWNRVTAEAR